MVNKQTQRDETNDFLKEQLMYWLVALKSARVMQ